MYSDPWTSSREAFIFEKALHLLFLLSCDGRIFGEKCESFNRTEPHPWLNERAWSQMPICISERFQAVRHFNSVNRRLLCAVPLTYNWGWHSKRRVYSLFTVFTLFSTISYIHYIALEDEWTGAIFSVHPWSKAYCRRKWTFLFSDVLSWLDFSLDSSSTVCELVRSGIMHG